MFFLEEGRPIYCPKNRRVSAAINVTSIMRPTKASTAEAIDNGSPGVKVLGENPRPWKAVMLTTIASYHKRCGSRRRLVNSAKSEHFLARRVGLWREC